MLFALTLSNLTKNKRYGGGCALRTTQTPSINPFDNKYIIHYKNNKIMENFIYFCCYLIGLTFVILDIMLLVRIWKMTNNVKSILDILKQQHKTELEEDNNTIEEDNNTIEELAQQYQDDIKSDKLQKIAFYGVIALIIIGIIILKNL